MARKDLLLFPLGHLQILAGSINIRIYIFLSYESTHISKSPSRSVSSSLEVEVVETAAAVGDQVLISATK